MAIDVGWVAGVIDARGHFSIDQAEGRRPVPRIRITTARYDILDALAAMTGNSVNKDHRPYDRRPCGEHCEHRHSHSVRQSAFWQAGGGRATIILHNIRPHVHGRSSEVRDMLLLGLQTFDPRRNGTADAMAALGWEIPTC